jgi:hypothetical protein
VGVSDAVDGGRWRGRQRKVRRASATIPVATIAAVFILHPMDGQRLAYLSKT